MHGINKHKKLKKYDVLVELKSSLDKICATITIKKGFKNSIGWNLKKNKSNQRFEPLTSTPKNKTKHNNVNNSIEIKCVQKNEMVKLVGMVTDCVYRTSRKRNKYMREDVQDDFGKVNFMLMNNRRYATLDNY